MVSRKMSRRFSRFASLSLGLAGVCLIALHVVLFWRRVADASIYQPEVLARWIGSGLLIGIAWAARRYAARHLQHRPLTWVFWLLVLLLHAGIPAEERLLDSGSLAVLIAAIPATLLILASGAGEAVTLRATSPAAVLRAIFPLPVLAPSSSPRSPPLR